MTVFARGIDYAWQHPDPQAIKDAGFDFVVRYYSRDPSKNLTRDEADALAKVGLWIVSNWEYGAQDALRGYDGGVSDATAARAQADVCGQPRTRPTYFSKDWDVTPAQEPTVTEYDRGADSVLGVAQVGDYAGFYPLRVQRDAGVISWEWQPVAWSGGQWEPRVNIRQTGMAVVGGVQVDVNEAWTQDYGQWQPGRLPFQSPQEAEVTPEEMATLAQLIENRQLGAIGTPAAAPTSTSLGVETASNPARWAALNARLDALAAAVKAIGTPPPATVDLAALEALIEQHLAAGSVPSVIAAAVLQHLSAATANAQP